MAVRPERVAGRRRLRALRVGLKAAVVAERGEQARVDLSVPAFVGRR
jgi:hypothetical protein